MQFSEEIDFRDGLVYDPTVKGFDSNFWKGDTVNLTFDTIRNAIDLGDTGLVGAASTYSQYLFGDVEFSLLLDSTYPDTTTDSEFYWGFRNIGDTLQRGAAYFDIAYDTTAGDSSPDTASFFAVIYDEQGNRQRTRLTWDTDFGGGGRVGRFRIVWEQDGYRFLVNDTVVATLGTLDSNNNQTATQQINTTIPQALRISKRATDTLDTTPSALKLLVIRNSRKVI